MKLYLQNIIDDISFEALPITWRGFDFEDKNTDKQNLFMSIICRK